MMINPEQVPKKVVRAAEKSWEKDTESFRPNAKTIAAALNAWPGMGIFEDETGWDVHIELPLLVPLPLPPQENSDDE